jgi:hypothetical protein
MRQTIFLLGLLLTLPLSAQPRFNLDWPAIAEHLVGRMALRPGEKVLAIAHPGKFEELIPHLRYQVMKAGGVDLGVIDVLAEPVPENWSAEILRQGWQPARVAWRSLLDGVDAAIMLPGASPAHPPYAAMQDVLREAKGRTVHFHWAETSAYPLPGRPLPAAQVIDATYQRALLAADYAGIAALQQRFEAALRSGEVRVTSPSGTDIRFRSGDRPVNRQDGDASAARAGKARTLVDREIELPCGAIRVAPLEESVAGSIAFPPSQWDGRPVEGLKLRFERGKVVELTAAAGKEAVEAEMSRAGDAGRSFREFALGFNPELAVPERNPWIPYYGYGAGVVRLSLGDNSELGGAVTGGYVRWNFFTDTTVSVAGEIWVRDGKLVRR